MSRTDMHRPYWVQAAERGTHEHHRHDLLGQPKVVLRKRRDGRGQVITKDVPVQITIRAALSLFPSLIADPAAAKRTARAHKEAKRLRSAGASLDELIDGPLLRTVPVTDEVTVGYYAGYCTVDDESGRGDQLADGVYAPCFKTFTGIEGRGAVGRWKSERASGINRPPRQEFREAEEIPTRQLVRLANAGADLD